MPTKLNLWHHGKEYTLERGAGEAHASNGGRQWGEADQWYVTLGGTALTTLPAYGNESEAGVCARLLDWLAAHPEMQDRNNIHLGGG